jgi:hypothetical protein
LLVNRKVRVSHLKGIRFGFSLYRFAGFPAIVPLSFLEEISDFLFFGQLKSMDKLLKGYPFWIFILPIRLFPRNRAPCISHGEF